MCKDSIFIWAFMVFVCLSYGDQKFMKLRNLKDLTTSQYDTIFSPHYSDKDRKHASQNVHLQDDEGRYIKLSYESKHPDDANILKLDEPLHQPNVLSLSCSTDANDHEIIALRFKSKKIAMRYRHDITSSLDADQRHFITAKHKWHCINPNKNRIEPIFREITAIKIDETDETQLILYTERAELVDVFETLSISYQSNINHGHTTHMLGIPTTPIGSAIPMHRRRLRGFWRRLWNGIKDGVHRAVDYINDVIDNIKVEEAADAIAIVVGFPIHKTKNFSNTWSWNYDNKSKHALDPITLSANLTCDDCFSAFDVVWSLEAIIKEHELQYLEVTVEGDVDITSEITLRGTHGSKDEYTEQTPKEPLPDISFSVASVDVDFNIYGEMAIGVATDLKTFAGGFKAQGKIKKGLQYNKTDTQHQYNYINEQGKLNYAMSGPQAELASGEVMMYVRPTLFLEMEHLGDFYFGLQPTFELNLTRDVTPKCAVHYAPALKLNTFIGGNLDFVAWHKNIDLAAVQTNLDNLAGCVDKSEVLRNQIPDVNTMALQNEYWMWTYNNDSIDTFYNADRRLLSADNDGDTQDTSTFINYHNVQLRPKFNAVSDKWNDRSLEWWGNLSEISDVCEDWSTVCSAYDLRAIKPHTGSLKVSLDNDSSLIGIFRSVIDIDPAVHWGLVDALIQTNVSCLARHRFVLLQDTYSTDGIRRYKVELLEWYCDTDLDKLGLDATQHKAWECMIRLPEEMSAISLDASLGSIVLFDSNHDWCHVYTLTTKPTFVLSEVNIDWNTVQYPSKLWYGIWDCELLLGHPAAEAELHFLSYNYTNGETQAILHYNSGNMSIDLNGQIDLEKMSIKLQSKDEEKYWNGKLEFTGVLNILADGTAIYAGSIEYDGCGGFLFQGYLNVEQFEHMNDGEDEDWWTTEEPMESVNVAKDGSWPNNIVIITFFVGMLTSAVIIVAVGALCRRRQKQNMQRNYALMGDTQL
eukprot:234794_1